MADDDSIVCSSCFTDTGLRIDAERIGIDVPGTCPNCGAEGFKKLPLAGLGTLAHRYFVWGSMWRARYGAAPLVQFNVRIPAKLDTDSTPSWTRIPEQAGQSERSDAGFWCFTLRMPSGSSFQSVSADADWLFQRLNRSATQSYPRPAARLRSYHSRLAGGRRWITRRTCGEGHGVTSGHSGFPFLRSDSPSRLRLCA